MISVTFYCGHRADFPDTIGESPLCPVCGERTIKVVQAPPPVFRGAASGPCAQPTTLPPLRIPVTKGWPSDA
jgi:hypothetical protein